MDFSGGRRLLWYLLRMRRFLLLIPALLMAACSQTSGPKLAPADHVYETRGVIERLQDRSDERLMILHEEIPDFVGFDGKVAPMGSMTMPFQVGPGVSVSGLAVGSKVAFTFELRWRGPVDLLITSLEILPEDTQLEVVDG